ncbi:hypothetical protein CEB3_c10460 [Peptococcaceae bacterium CEB3]|nr:hypothetical protein CEB3_c10460 [Peptococcaceae bacterium CEB3]
MPLSPSQVILYAADSVDYEVALAAAASAGIVATNVIGDFPTVWNLVASGSYLVIAVGGPATNALFYNPCDWDNLSVVPFNPTASYPVDTLPGANYYENAAGSDRTASLYLATVFAYYAVNGSLPTNWTNSPTPASAVDTCGGSISINCPCQATSCLNGLDSDSDLSSEASCMWTNTPYWFLGRYLGGPCYPGTPLSESEASTLSNTGFWLMSIYSGANYTSKDNCGTQSYSQGQSDGQQAVSMAQGVGQPLHSAIYLDLEANQLNQSNYLGYVQGWVSAVSTGGYVPGVYSSPSQLNTIQSQSWAGNSILYWNADWIYSSVQTPAPCPSSELSFAQGWQYAGLASLRNIGIDIDSAQNVYGMWKI